MSKHFASLCALDNIDLEIPDGQFFGLLGPNGAGKSTLINSIVGLSKIQTGEIKVFGHHVKNEYLKSRQAIGFAPQEANVDRYFNVIKTLTFQGGFFGLDKKNSTHRANELLEKFSLSTKRKEQFFKLSGGMQRRVLIARALMSFPRLLILDEPTAGVDVEQRQELWATLRELKKEGLTLFLTTHYIDEAEELCDEVAIINHGKILKKGSPQDLIQKYTVDHLSIQFNRDLNPDQVNLLPGYQIIGNSIAGHTNTIGRDTSHFTLNLLKDPTLKVEDIQVKKGSLEDVFIKITGKSFIEEEQC